MIYISNFDYTERLVKLATNEMNTVTNGYGGLINKTDFVNNPGNVITIIASLLSPYYKEIGNQERIDHYLKSLLAEFNSDYGVYSIHTALSKKFEELEPLLKELKTGDIK